MPARRSDLYFILNPALGIIKIGISVDVRSRRSELEHACGVALTVLRVVPQGEPFEEPLHFAFLPSRLIGEWFAPTDELLALIEGDEPMEAFIARKATDISEHRRAYEENAARRFAMQQAAARADREEAQRLREEEGRLKAERLAKAEAARVRRQEVRAAEDDEARQAFAAKRDATQAATRGRFAQLHDDEAIGLADSRRAMVGQRLRNAELVGVEPLPLEAAHV